MVKAYIIIVYTKLFPLSKSTSTNRNKNYNFPMTHHSDMISDLSACEVT